MHHLITGAKRMPLRPRMDRRSSGQATGERKAVRSSISYRDSIGSPKESKRESHRRWSMKLKGRSKALVCIPGVFWVGAAVFSPHASLAGPYTLAPGDTIEVSISGLPEQRNKEQIQ